MYTAVAHYIDWVTSTILRSGGMEACGYTIQASQALSQGLCLNKTRAPIIRCLCHRFKLGT